MTGSERTGWRDEKISNRHRDFYGQNCPMTNVDFLVVEYDRLEAVAIIDYKHCAKGVQPWEPKSDPNLRVLVKVADSLGIPCLVAIYHDEDWWYRVFPLNDAARRFYEDGQDFSEVGFVQSLYAMRGRAAPVEMLVKLKLVKRQWASSTPINRD